MKKIVIMIIFLFVLIGCESIKPMTRNKYKETVKTEIEPPINLTLRGKNTIYLNIDNTNRKYDSLYNRLAITFQNKGFTKVNEEIDADYVVIIKNLKEDKIVENSNSLLEKFIGDNSITSYLFSYDVFIINEPAQSKKIEYYTNIKVNVKAKGSKYEWAKTNSENELVINLTDLFKKTQTKKPDKYLSY